MKNELDVAYEEIEELLVTMQEAGEAALGLADLIRDKQRPEVPVLDLIAASLLDKIKK
ncbi:hypothetical protein HC725_06195 [Vibrio sp. S17_S38]|uniref:hypothetical protein n=1 Tax=Vibrio sp. S17_S38 TaxID=2720229 RepID=UPI00168117B0|nr:hypothetical protein [Vibrio sp. S17_S38]MBD1572870.1 hypothetical protein [Vibrio sp. S17_S38]